MLEEGSSHDLVFATEVWARLEEPCTPAFCQALLKAVEVYNWKRGPEVGSESDLAVYG